MWPIARSTPVFRQGQPRTNKRKCGIQPANQSLITDVFRSRPGALPISLGDGVPFVATADDRRQPLDGRCDVRIAGMTPTARYFTLTLYDPDGRLVANSVNRHSFASEELYRSQDGSFEIAVAPRARPGNWLPSGGLDRYLLVLKL